MDQQPPAELIAQWQARGMIVLPRFYADAEIDAVLADYRRLWDQGRARVTVDDMDTERRMRLRDVPQAARRTHRFKVNDLYLEQASVRQLALNERLVPLLHSLLGQRPALCNSLSLEYGTAQRDHVDSLYMTPRTPNDLVAAWVALEDCTPEAGPLRYWPGSHLIEPFVFSNGERHYVPAEMDAWHAHIESQVRQRGLAPEVFLARKGDVFLWNAHLLHGGSAIAKPGSTRRSVVFHYFSEGDSRALGMRLVPEAGGFWIRRSHQPIPGSLQAQLRQLAARLRRRLRGRAAAVG
jgi:ectoine hydroxylase-related dioxygenase (phytanoyl-CoA dioxygenase family)